MSEASPLASIPRPGPDATVQELVDYIAALEAKVEEVHSRVETFTEEIMRKQIEISASQIQALFENPVMNESICSVLLNTMQNVILFKANSSKNRRPRAMLTLDYIPKSSRLQLDEDGVLHSHKQAEGSRSVEEEWVLDEEVKANESTIDAIRLLMKSYGFDDGRVCYLTTDINLQEYREQLSDDILKV